MASALVVAGVATTQAARAQDAEAPAEAPVHVHGFVSQGYLLSTANDYLTDGSTNGSFEFTEAGLNFTTQPTDDLRLGVQVFARDLGNLGNYKPQLDWFYLDYHFADWLGMRAGRTKIPFGLYNETNDIDAARVPILLPQSVYPIENRDYLLAQTGLEAYGSVPLGGAGELEYRAYGGTIHIDTTDSSVEIKKLAAPYLFGGRLMWQTPLDGLQAGGSAQALRLDLDYVPPPEAIDPLEAAGLLPPDYPGSVKANIWAFLWIGSLEYTAHDLQLAAEYSRWRVRLKSSLQPLFPDSLTQSERFYGLAAYRFNRWFQPGVYYSALFPDASKRSGRDAVQHDVAMTLRYDLNPHWLLKIEGHYMRGTAGLDPSLNDNTPRTNLTRDWGVFLAKTTAYF